MRQIVQLRCSLFRKILRVLLWAVIVTGSHSGDSAALESPPIPFHLNASEKESVQLVRFYPAQTGSAFPKEHRKAGGSERVAVSIEQTRQILLLGGLLVLVGTFFIPYMLPQLTGYHEKITHFLEQTVRTYKTIFHLPVQRFVAPAPANPAHGCGASTTGPQARALRSPAHGLSSTARRQSGVARKSASDPE